MKLENEILYVEMVEHGAELTRIYNKKTGAEILWNADPKFWKRHSPVLFPNVGKTWHNVVKIQGEQYPTSQHGFARDHDFKCIYAGKEEVKFLLTSTDEMKEVYPFDFELYISYRLKKNVIQRNLKILRISVLFVWMQERLKQCLHRQRWIRSS